MAKLTSKEQAAVDSAVAIAMANLEKGNKGKAKYEDEEVTEYAKVFLTVPKGVAKSLGVTYSFKEGTAEGKVTMGALTKVLGSDFELKATKATKYDSGLKRITIKVDKGAITS